MFRRSPILRSVSLIALSGIAACSSGGSQATRSPSVLPELRQSGAVKAPSCPCFKVVYNFGQTSTDAAGPEAKLHYSSGAFYGTTANGGSSSAGTAYKLTLTGAENVLHSFAQNGTDGYEPLAGVEERNGTFYGTTDSGGSLGDGIVYSMAPGGKETVLHNFGGMNDGIYPKADLIYVNGAFYGTTEAGGTGNYGTVFRITPQGDESVIFNFNRTDGAYPFSKLLYLNGILYGTTQQGGAYLGGTVFRLTLTGKEHVVHSFGNGVDGDYPDAGLIAVKGVLYGTASGGGKYNSGTVFSVSTTGSEQTLYSFQGAGTFDGGGPLAELTNVNGVLYGTTSYGGGSACAGNGCGTIFSATQSGQEQVLHSFTGTDGNGPAAQLTDVKGVLYGTTFSGGTATYTGGTAFSLKP